MPPRTHVNVATALRICVAVVAVSSSGAADRIRCRARAWPSRSGATRLAAAAARYRWPRSAAEPSCASLFGPGGPVGPTRLRAGRRVSGAALRDLGAEREADRGRRRRRAGRHPTGLAGPDRAGSRTAAARRTIGSASVSPWPARSRRPAPTSRCPSAPSLGDLLALAGGMAAAVYTAFGERVRTATSTLGVHHDLLQRLRGPARCGVPDRPACGCTVIRPRPGWRSWRLVCGAQLLGHSMFSYALHRVSATTVSVLILLEVPGAALLAWLWLGQVPPPAQSRACPAAGRRDRGSPGCPPTATHRRPPVTHPAPGPRRSRLPAPACPPGFPSALVDHGVTTTMIDGGSWC